MIVDGTIEPMELGHLRYKKATYEDYLGRAGLDRWGKKRWRHYVEDVVERLIAVLEPDDVVIELKSNTVGGTPLRKQKSTNTASMERIRKVLELVGKPEEFERIREEVFRES
jgi:hypothetical protein